MKLEINLLRIDGIDATIGASLSKKYYDFSEDGKNLGSILEFLKENKDYFDETVAKNLSDATEISAIDLQCLIYLLNLSGLQLLIRVVDDMVELTKGSTEVLITNYNQTYDGFIPYAKVKVVEDEELDVEEVFRTVDNTFELFDHEVFKGVSDPFMDVVDQFAPVEATRGQVPQDMIDYCSSIINQVGIDIFRIVPNE